MSTEITVIAKSPAEMVEAQRTLIEQTKSKHAQALIDLRDADDLLHTCTAAGISTSQAKRMQLLVKSRVMYLEKITSALEAGFVIVPNFPGNVIAIRTKREYPKPQRLESEHYQPHLHNDPSEILKIGEGRYVDPTPIARNFQDRDNTGKPIAYITYPDGYDDMIELPVDFLKPTIIEATGKAMAIKVFDEIVTTSDMGWQNGDPMVLGRIIDRKRRRQLSFLIAWFIDSKDI